MINPQNKTWAQRVEEVSVRTGNDNKDFKDWMMSKEGLGYFFDYNLWSRAYHIYKSLKDKSDDHLTVIVGPEGIGKTTLAAQLAAVTSPGTFRMRNIVFSPRDFLNELKVGSPGDVVQIDEGALVFFSGDASQKGSNLMIKLLTVMREKRVHTIVCIPDLFLLRPYVREKRLKTLIHIEKKGRYKAYINHAIAKISLDAPKLNKRIELIKVNPNSTWDGYWNDLFPVINDVNLVAYRKKKHDNLNSFIDEADDYYSGLVPKKDVESQEEIEKNIALLPLKEAVKLLPVGYETIKAMIERGELKGIKMGKNWFVNKQSLYDSLVKSTVSLGNEPLVAQGIITGSRPRATPPDAVIKA